MNCPHCRDSRRKKGTTTKACWHYFIATEEFCGHTSLSGHFSSMRSWRHGPVIEFMPTPNIYISQQKLQFSSGCRMIMHPDSFFSLTLPFVYGIELEDGKLHPFTPFENKPHLIAWITKGTTLQIVFEGSNLEEGSFT